MHNPCRVHRETRRPRFALRPEPLYALGSGVTRSVALRAERAPVVQARTARPRERQIETGMRLVVWALQRHSQPTPAEIAEHFRVHRATAYRYHAALADVLGQPRLSERDRGIGATPAEA